MYKNNIEKKLYRENKMVKNFKDFYFIRGENPNYFYFKEVPIFYNNNIEYSAGFFWRVMVISPQRLNEKINNNFKQKNDDDAREDDQKKNIKVNAEYYCETTIKSLIYLNYKKPKKELYLKYLEYKNKVDKFSKYFSDEYFNFLYENRETIERIDCYIEQKTLILNEVKIAKSLGFNYLELDYRDKNIKQNIEKLKEKLKEKQRKYSKIANEEQFNIMVPMYFRQNIHASDMSLEKLKNIFKKNDVSIKKYLLNSGIEVKNGGMTFIDKGLNEVKIYNYDDALTTAIKFNIDRHYDKNIKLNNDYLINNIKVETELQRKKDIEGMIKSGIIDKNIDFSDLLNYYTEGKDDELKGMINDGFNIDEVKEKLKNLGVIKLTEKKLRDFFIKNPEYRKKVKEFNLEYTKRKKRVETILKIKNILKQFNNIENYYNDDFNFKRKIKIKDDWGKIKEVEFNSEFGDDADFGLFKEKNKTFKKVEPGMEWFYNDDFDEDYWKN